VSARVLPSFGWTRRQSVRAAIVLAALAVGAALWRWDLGPDPARAEVVWQVDLGLFSALLTALTIVFAVTLTPQTRWPSLGDLVGGIAVASWLGMATIGIACAAAGDLLGSRGLAGAGAVFTVVQLGFGLDTLWVLMRFRSAAGRRAILVRLTTRRLHRAAESVHEGVAEHPELADLREEIEYSIDRNDVAELAARVEEIVEGCARDTTAAQARCRLAVQTNLLERLGRSVLFESLSGDAARAAVPPLVRGVLRASWQLSALTFPDRAAPHRDEVPAAVALGQICRVIGWLQQCAHERLQASPDDPASRQIVQALIQGQLQIVQFVDPDPPGFFRAPNDPWPYGFSDPAAALVWLAMLCDFGGAHAGNGLYILCEVLTGEKFFGNYWHGDCIFTEIERRLPVADDASGAAALLASCGGLGPLSLELAATVIAGMRDRRFVPPAGWENVPHYSTDRRYVRNQVTMFTTYDCVPDADAAIDWLAGALTGAPTRASLGNVVQAATARYGEPSRIPLRMLGERPAAVTLAALLRLAANHPAQARALLRRLPPPLLAGALQHARFALVDAGPAEPVAQTWGPQAVRALGPRGRQEGELTDILTGVLADD
jgi:hypothetical protein